MGENATKRIPVTEERWRELHDLKDAGQTYDDLLGELVEEYKKRRLFGEMDAREESGEFEEL